MMAGRLRVVCLLLSDLISISLAWTVSVVLVGLCKGQSDILTGLLFWFTNYWQAIVIFPIINWIARLYHGRGFYPAMPIPEVEELRRLVLSSAATHILVLAYLTFSKISSAEMSNWVLLLSAFLTAFGSQPMRYAVRFVLARCGWGRIACFVVGEGPTAEHLVSSLSHSSYYGFAVVRRFTRDDLREVVAAGAATGVRHLFACYGDDRLFKVQFAELSRQFTFIEYLPTAESFPTSGAQVVQVGGLGGLEMTNQRRLKLLAIEKSVLDRTLALMIFLLALPFFVVMPILIRLTSKGPVLYKAKRLGKMGRTIYVWKFRSMYADADRRLESLLASDPKLAAEFAADFKLKNDPRITPLGKFMRKTSIDELPQLFNVFTHDMALIGPRPIVEGEVGKYGKDYEIFSSVKPGITGLWQASGRNNTDYAARVALDVHYVLNWSPWMDIWIVFKTALSVLTMRGSY